MIAYLDTSAIVPLLVAEPSTSLCQRIWQDADRLVSSALAYVEAAAALAMAQRQLRITSKEREIAWSRFTEIWPDVDIVEVDTQLLVTAAELTSEFSLRGYDAVHCASAKLIDDPDLVVAAGDAQLLDAWSRLGLAVLDVNQG
ncbi:hypothetical protein FB554_1235 [Barrientosiimonas humi]|uniref:Ribonuclease VapC n=1 Tax=Barrientosiimonas humi TaxID=999931 RepID=A0A542XBA0_9MICO|nr:type II toxin-antitoxin system VapC family toxin [Barrientosiimonas humi]TQL33101.1 hypothetical protein FB554_1235 [Barrientosiimonas humi]CAG7573091.1 Ribonuclease VapC49 [Barrientosiimonas humi]